MQIHNVTLSHLRSKGFLVLQHNSDAVSETHHSLYSQAISTINCGFQFVLSAIHYKNSDISCGCTNSSGLTRN